MAPQSREARLGCSRALRGAAVAAPVLRSEFWEIAIKTALGKLELPAAPERFVPEQLAEDGIDSLAIEHSHALRIAGLARHHSDPFDRLLVAQAQLERCAFLTADAQILDYDVEVVWGGRQAPPRARSRRRS